MMDKKVDYLIIGQGLAGSFLAFQLLQQSKSVLVIDEGLQFSSSYIAAGVINPLVLRRYTKSWRAEEFLKYNSSFYDSVEALLNKKYLFSTPIKKLISSPDEENFWKVRLKKEDLSAFMAENLLETNNSALLKGNFKTGLVKQTSWLNISAFLTDFRAYLVKEKLLLDEVFNYDQLKNQSYKNISFNKIIFCEGANALKNPLFPANAFSLNKGQLMTIKSTEMQTEDILKKKVFILPTAKNEYKVGATYSWKWENVSENGSYEVEEEKSAKLKEMLKEMCDVEYTILEENAGVRPAVKDRRPLMGQHPEKNRVFFFNGMGSKGCLMAPLLSKEFVDYLDQKAELNSKVKISRYF